MRFDESFVAAGVTPKDALAWWSDFHEGRSDHTFVPGQKRRILGREKDGSVTMEDKSPYFREVTTARVLRDRVTFEGINSVSRFAGSYVFEPVPEGTRVRLEADVELKPTLRAATPLASPIARAILRADLRAHVRELVKERRGRAASSPSSGDAA